MEIRGHNRGIHLMYGKNTQTFRDFLDAELLASRGSTDSVLGWLLTDRLGQPLSGYSVEANDYGIWPENLACRSTGDF